MHTKKLIVFSDLDGTLLDHDSYSWEPARSALNTLAELAIPVVLCTSKTAAEVTELHRQMPIEAPFIVENGSAVIFPASAQNAESSAYFFGKKYSEVLSILHQLRLEKSYRFTGFHDMTTTDVARATALPAEQAELARQRLSSEPLIWEDSESALEQFKRELLSHGVKILQGGRFYHALDTNSDKGTALLWLLRHLSDGINTHRYFSIALGDGPNDLDMLETADLAVVIPSASGRTPAPRNNKILHAKEPGPTGWNQAILDILKLHFNSGA